MSRRTEKIASLMRQEIATIIQREINDPRLPAITSVTRVKVAEDLSTADVYVTIMGSPGQQNAGLNALKHSAGMMRGILTKSMNLRTAPFIKFHFDEGLKKEMALLDLLHKVKQEQDEIDAARAAKQAAEGGGGDAPPGAKDGQAENETRGTNDA